MIQVKYDHTKQLSDGQLPVKYIQVGEEIQASEQNFGDIPTHYREKSYESIRRIGIQLCEPFAKYSLAISSPDSKKIESLTYSKKHNIWYQKEYFSTKKNDRGQFLFDEKVFVAGVSSVGTVSIVDLVTYSDLGKINFFPSSLSIEEYDSMLTELYMISEDLIRENKNLAKVSVTTKNQISVLEEQIKNLTISLKQINQNPHKELKRINVLKKTYNNKNFNAPLEIQKKLNPGKSTYKISALQPVVNNIENQMIKQVLKQLQSYLSLKKTNPLFNKHLFNRLNIEKEFLLENSQLNKDMLTNQRNIGTSDQLIYSEITRLKESITTFEAVENANIDFIQNKKQDINLIDGEDISIKLILNKNFLPEHNLKHSINGKNIDFRISFNNYSYEARSKFKFVSYKIGEKTKTPQSYFGEIRMVSSHISSHFKLNHLFFQLNHQNSSPLNVTIVGKIKPVPPPRIDFISYKENVENKYPKYLVNLVCISQIFINDQVLSIDENDDLLQVFMKQNLAYEHSPIEIDTYEQNLISLKKLEKFSNLNQQILQLHDTSSDYQSLNNQVLELLNLPILNEVSSPYKIPLKPTSVFLHNPSYRLAWQAITKIQREPYISLISAQHNHLISTNKSHQIYEVWALFKMIQILSTEMGWTLQGSHSVNQFLQNYLVRNNSLDNFNLVLTKELWTINIYYEPLMKQEKILPERKWGRLTPDFVFKFSYNSVIRGMSIIDTKYRNYNSQGIKEWKKDIENIAILKYGNMTPSDSKWKIRILSSSIMHSTADSSFAGKQLCHPYHVLYNSQLFKLPFNSDNAHRYSSIVMTPSNQLFFKNWFRMQLEYHLGSYKTCWNCGESEHVQEKQLTTQSGYAKFHYTCESCNEFWVKVHCKEHGHNLIKHLTNYHLQKKNNRFSKWYVKCPKCDDIIKEDEEVWLDLT